MTDPASFFASNAWVPIVIGIVLALVVHTGKTLTRPAANVATAGFAAPVLSTAEDVSSVVLSIVALLFPVLVILGVIGLVAGLIALFRRMRRTRRERTAADQSATVDSREPRTATASSTAAESRPIADLQRRRAGRILVRPFCHN